jgi:hypothetical protein
MCQNFPYPLNIRGRSHGIIIWKQCLSFSFLFQEGDVWPNSSAEITVYFNPLEAKLYQQTVYCDISGMDLFCVVTRLPSAQTVCVCVCVCVYMCAYVCVHVWVCVYIRMWESIYSSHLVLHDTNRRIYVQRGISEPTSLKSAPWQSFKAISNLGKT